MNMNKPEISIVLPGIRRDNWKKLYDSIEESTKRTFELIIVGPTEPPPSLNVKSVKFFKDLGNPVRASNIAASLAEGKLITWAADDGVYIPSALDNNINLLYSMPDKGILGTFGNVVVAKYYEGETKILQPDYYFKINGADCTRSPQIPDHWWIFNVAIMYRKYFDYLKGWSPLFEVCPMAHTDMAIRAQDAGSEVLMSNYPLLDKSEEHTSELQSRRDLVC